MTAPLLVTSGAGEKRRLNPLAVVGWREGDVPGPEGARVYLGTIMALVTGEVIGVREGIEQFDWLWTRAVNSAPADPVSTIGETLGPARPDDQTNRGAET